ncbi:MAG: lysozyme inhibitor LprI family protein [Syntrophobacteraceae bacterium]
MIRLLAVAIISTLTMLPSFTIAAGFDCRKAASTVEKLICSDDALSKADEQLSTVYGQALASAADAAAFKKEEINWIRTERDKCRTKECLAAAYKKRIEVLSAPSPSEEYWLREPFSTTLKPHDEDSEEEWDGPWYHACVKVHGPPTAPLIDFEVYFPDSGQSVSAEYVRTKASSGGDLEFEFTDSWGNRGKGTFTQRADTGTLVLEEVKAGEPGRGRMALRMYGDYMLEKQKCGSEE